MIKTILLILQIAVPVLLITLILLQQRGTALGAAFGGEGGGFYSKRIRSPVLPGTTSSFGCTSTSRITMP